MSKVAHTDARNDAAAAERAGDTLTKVASQKTRGAADTARENLRLDGKTAADGAEGREETGRRSVHDAAAFGQTVMAVLSEQARHNMAVATAFGRAADWEELVRTQKEFIDGSFGRMSRLGALYRELLQSGMASGPFAPRR